MKRSMGLPAILLALAAAVPASGQEGPSEELVAAAQAEGEVVLYTSIPDSRNQAWADAFKAAYPGIEVSWIRLVSSALFTRYTGEIDSGVSTPDVLISGSAGLYIDRPELFQDLSDLPGIAENKGKPQNPHYAVLYASPHVVAYNTNLVTEQDLAEHFATWEGMADPLWKGRVAVMDPAATPNNMSFYKVMQETYGDEVLRGLAANEPVYFDSGTPAAQQVAAGAFAIALPEGSSQTAAVIEAGAPVANYTPEGPAHAIESSMALPVNPPHPNAARLFAQWMLMPDGGQLVACNTGGVPMVEVQGDCLPLSPEHRGSEESIPQEMQDQIESLLGR